MSEYRPIETEAKQATIADLYEQYYDRLVRYIYIGISDHSEAENLAGDIFLRVRGSLGSYKGDGDQMRSWLFRIAHDMVVDYLRKNGNRRGPSLADEDMADKHSIEELATTKLEQQRLLKAMEQVTPAQREVIGLRFFGDLTSAEVSKIMGESDSAVREMQRTALESLQKLMRQIAIISEES